MKRSTTSIESLDLSTRPRRRASGAVDRIVATVLNSVLNSVVIVAKRIAMASVRLTAASVVGRVNTNTVRPLNYFLIADVTSTSCDRRGARVLNANAVCVGRNCNRAEHTESEKCEECFFHESKVLSSGKLIERRANSEKCTNAALVAASRVLNRRLQSLLYRLSCAHLSIVDIAVSIAILVSGLHNAAIA